MVIFSMGTLTDEIFLVPTADWRFVGRGPNRGDRLVGGLLLLTNGRGAA
jgi:hypothetical protein